jgi:hypothetical protein
MRSVAVLLGLIALPCFGQAPIRVMPGDQVRLTRTAVVSDKELEAGMQVRGTLLAHERDTLVIVQQANTFRIARSEIVRLDVARGARRPFVQHTAIGLLAGAIVGGFVGLTSGSDYETGGSGNYVTSTTILGAGAGSAIGLAVGLKPRTTWVRVRL